MGISPVSYSALQRSTPEKIMQADQEPKAGAKSSWGEDGFTFGDLIDVINPLQHIPVISTLYRQLTGDTISEQARLAGGSIYGGPIGFGVAMANVVTEDTTGKDIGANVVAALFEKDKAIPDTQLAQLDASVTDEQIAALAPSASEPQIAAAAPQEISPLPAFLLAENQPAMAAPVIPVTMARKIEPVKPQESKDKEQQIAALTPFTSAGMKNAAQSYEAAQALTDLYGSTPVDMRTLALAVAK